MRGRILDRLSVIERDEGVRIVYACESGSRAWGFASADSDYDVRFIYVHPVERYLSIVAPGEVIEPPIEGELDLSGWDLRKALALFRKSNPPLMEWLGSPIVYIERGSTAAELRRLAGSYHSPKASAFHYLSMAQGNYREHLRGERVWVKKYFYVLRPILAVIWIERGLGVVPTEFELLVNGLDLDAGLLREIAQLIAAKRAGLELDEGPRIAPISDFVERELARLDQSEFAFEKPRTSTEPLDALFRRALDEA